VQSVRGMKPVIPLLLICAACTGTLDADESSDAAVPDDIADVAASEPPAAGALATAPAELRAAARLALRVEVVSSTARPGRAGEDYAIMTDVVVEVVGVESRAAGAPLPGRTLTIVQPGGTLADRSVTSSEYPALAPGDRFVLVAISDALGTSSTLDGLEASLALDFTHGGH
jgi:hypothetical protein